MNTNVKSEWLNGDLYFYDKNGNEICHFDGTNRKLVVPAGSVLEADRLGLGGSDSILKTEAGTHTLVAAHATKDRAVVVVVKVDETYAVGTGTLPTVKIGETDALEKGMAASVLDTEAAGTMLVYAFTNTATKAIVATSTAAVGNATGGCTITVTAIPTT
jgi:hypothetical protein